MQRELTAALGTVGATHVRFLFGFPFALVFLAGVLMATGLPLPQPPLVVLAVGAARRRRADRRHRADAGDHERPLVRGHHRLHQDRGGAGRAVRPDLPRRSGDARHGGRHPGRHRRRGGDVAQGHAARWRAAAGRCCSGCSPARMFALSAIGYRGAILSLGLPSFVLAATFTVTVGLVLQAGAADALSRAARPRRAASRSCAPGGRRCSRASWARPRRNSGSWRLR